jgi:hypothetical protein
MNDILAESCRRRDRCGRASKVKLVQVGGVLRMTGAGVQYSLGNIVMAGVLQVDGQRVE